MLFVFFFTVLTVANPMVTNNKKEMPGVLKNVLVGIVTIIYFIKSWPSNEYIVLFKMRK